MDLIAIKKQIRYQNTHSQGLSGSGAVLWRLSGHNPRDQDKTNSYFFELRLNSENPNKT